MDDKTLKALLGAQQGELDAVLMYQSIAKKIKNEEIKALLLDSAKDEGRHASVFHKITKIDLRPKRTLAILVPILMTILGKKLVFRVIAKSEYGVKGSYEKMNLNMAIV